MKIVKNLINVKNLEHYTENTKKYYNERSSFYDSFSKEIKTERMSLKENFIKEIENNNNSGFSYNYNKNNANNSFYQPFTQVSDFKYNTNKNNTNETNMYQDFNEMNTIQKDASKLFFGISKINEYYEKNNNDLFKLKIGEDCKNVLNEWEEIKLEFFVFKKFYPYIFDQNLLSIEEAMKFLETPFEVLKKNYKRKSVK